MRVMRSAWILGLACFLGGASALAETPQALRGIDFFKPQNGEVVHINLGLARHLYLEHVTLKSSGVDFLNGCDAANIDKHKPLAVKTVPVIQHKGFTIVASPYHSVPVDTGKNNNARYIERLKAAIAIIETDAPKSFVAIQQTLAKHNGYIIVDNICPIPGGLAFAAFVPRASQDTFVVMVSSTLLLMTDMFSDYDVAAQLIHEMEGHAVDYYTRGTTDEIHAFRVQAQFAETVGNDKFKHRNNFSHNIKSKIRLSLSTAGTYVESDPLILE